MRTGGHDNPPQRGGLLAARGLIAMECWSFDADEAGLDLRYGRQLEACRRVFARCGHRVERTAADPGTMGREAHAFVRFASGGGDVCMACRSCGRLEEAEIAAFRRDAPAAEEPLPVEEVAAPGTSTIEGLAAFLHITPSRTAKAVLMAGEGDDGRSKLVLALIRGDLEVS